MKVSDGCERGIGVMGSNPVFLIVTYVEFFQDFSLTAHLDFYLSYFGTPYTAAVIRTYLMILVKDALPTEPGRSSSNHLNPAFIIRA